MCNVVSFILYIDNNLGIHNYFTSYRTYDRLGNGFHACSNKRNKSITARIIYNGTAVTNTIQQIGGALGTSISVSILANGMKNYLNHSTMPTLNSELIKAMATGSHNVFIYSMTIALLGLTASSFIKNSKLLKV